MSVSLEFVGHACFRVWKDGRPSILTDPFTHSEFGLKDDGTRLETDTVIVSSLTDESHDNVKLAAGTPRVINALEVARGEDHAVIDGEPVIAVEAGEHPDHTEHSPHSNALYAFKVDNLWFLHMGDLGYQLSDEQLTPFVDHCDVFLVITGAWNTPSFEELDPMIDFVRPRWVVPMHYNLPPISFEMSKVEKFIEHRARDPVLEVRHHTVEFPLPVVKPEHPTIVVFEPSAYIPTK